jgi:uncharacterized membrane protein YeaQ/YmgE (transglycosylase-associated protein family)
LQEVAQQAIEYLKVNYVLSFGVAFVSGTAAIKSVAHERRTGVLVYLIVGLIGFFLGEFVIFYFGFQEYLEEISAFRILFDLIAGYIGSFFVAAIIHFIKPM